MAVKVLITVPHPSFHGGVGNIFKVLKLDRASSIKYFYNTRQNKSADLISGILMIIRFTFEIKKFDAVHLNPSLDFKAVVRDGILLLISKMWGKKVIVFFHGWDDSFENRLYEVPFYKFVFQFVFGRTDQFILLGDIFYRKLWRLGIRNKPVDYMPTVADDTFCKAFDRITEGAKSQRVNLLFIGGFVNGKGIDIVLRSFQLLLKFDLDLELTLTLAGDGPELERCKQFVSDNQIKNINFAGYVSGKKKHDCFVFSDILFFPSLSEGLPCVIMEAMLYGLAIVTRPIGAIPDWVKHNVNGWLSDSMDPRVFAEGILYLLSQPDILDRMKSVNQEIACQNFTPVRISEKINKVYANLLN